MPNTPGSIGASETTARSGCVVPIAASARRTRPMTSGSVNGAEPRTTAATLTHRIVHTARNTMEPVSQMAARATGQSGVESCATGVAGAPDVIASGIAKGWLTVLSAADSV